MQSGTHFRLDIEGLRAVAILLVVAAHAGVQALEGGFVGVDVFFVISGFLITSLLFKEYHASGKIDLSNFYSRRLKRLLPALMVMILLVSLLAAVFLAPHEQLEQSNAAMSALGWVSNIYFALANYGYFEAGSESNLFLHTWSLGVEEQFYLIWPLLIMLVAGLYSRQAGPGNTQKLTLRLSFVVLVFFLLALVLHQSKPIWSFYLMPARAWQFAAGALVFSYTSDSGEENRWGQLSPMVRRMAGWLGLALILLSALWLDSASPYPGWRAVLPTLGTCLVLLSGTTCVGAGYSVGSLLSLAPLQFIGRISYSWYLWHWPVFLLGPIIGGQGLFSLPQLTVVSLGLAGASYLLIEKPIRGSAWLSLHKWVNLSASLLVIVLLIFASGVWKSYITQWGGSEQQLKYKAFYRDLPRIYSDGCDSWYHSDRLDVCSYGRDDAKHTVVLLGDSIGAQWFPALHNVYRNPDWRFVVLTKSSCPIIDKSFFYSRLGRNFIECDSWRNKALEWIQDAGPSVVFMGTISSGFSEEDWIEGTARVLDKISGSAGEIFILRGTHRLPFDGLSCLARWSWQTNFFAARDGCNSASSSPGGDNIYSWLQLVAKKYPNVHALDLNGLICPEGRCYAQLSKVPVFRDHQHVTASFMRLLDPASIISRMKAAADPQGVAE
ncbi:MAG: acyltransferase family protein [Halioglobus sp.]